jgi:hypothetical protein
MPPHLVRYVASLTDPGQVAETPAPAAAADDAPSLTITAGPEAGHVDQAAPDAIQADGHVDQGAAARWHQAQTELAGLIREEGRTLAANPDAAPVLPDQLAPWLEQRVSQLEQTEPEIS